LGLQSAGAGLQPAMPAGVSSRALTAAALALPGLVPSPAHAAEGDELGFQYGRYQEGERDLFGVESKFVPSSWTASTAARASPSSIG